MSILEALIGIGGLWISLPSWMEEHGDDLRDDPIAEQLCKGKQSNQACIDPTESVPIAFSYQGKRIRPELDREKFKELTEDLMERTLMTVELVLDEAEVKWSDLTRLILVGGSTRMPMIHELSRLVTGNRSFTVA